MCNEFWIGIVRAESCAKYRDVIAAETERQEIDSAIFGCTEVGMLMDQSDTDLPVVDSTEVHVRAALNWALDGH